MNDFDSNLELSGYNKARRAEIFKAGLTGYKRKAMRNLEQTGYSRHAPGHQGRGRRTLQKVADKTRWFRKKSKGDLRTGEDKEERRQGAWKDKEEKCSLDLNMKE